MCTECNLSSGFGRCLYFVQDTGWVQIYEPAFCHCIGIDIIACFLCLVFGVQSRETLVDSIREI
jgi:hypothetical protein